MLRDAEEAVRDIWVSIVGVESKEDGRLATLDWEALVSPILRPTKWPIPSAAVWVEEPPLFANSAKERSECDLKLKILIF